MNGVTDGLWIAACASAVAALAVTATGRTQTQRGWGLWQLALWLVAGGIALGAAAGSRPGLRVLAQALLLPWPALVLVGMRRFHARLDWPGGERHDWWMLAACLLALVLSGLAPADAGVGILGSMAVPAALLLLHLYAAALLVCTGTGPGTRPLHLLGAVIALAACAPMAAGLPGHDAQALFEASAVASALAALAMAFIVITLAFDRHQRHLRASRRRLRALASIDPLTQMPNRRHFEEMASQALSQDPPASAVLMMFDIDHFKHINDRCGHAGGDRALRLVSRGVREVLRVQDVPCRHGGDEFALLLRRAHVHDAMRVASRLVERVQAAAADARLPALTLSFGMVQVRPGERLEQALERADQALYEAKRQGRARAVAAGGHGSEPCFTESRPLGLTHA
jgi:diguanylate cyclase (GGDEF)-like protein